MNAKFTLLTNSGKGVITYKDGSKIIIDKDKVFYSATIPNEEMFDLMPTRGVIFSFPYKLKDPGTRTSYSNTEKKKFLTEKLTLAGGADWRS
jgi:hypothetical protein